MIANFQSDEAVSERFAFLSPMGWFLVDPAGLFWTQDQAEIPADLLILLISLALPPFLGNWVLGFEPRFPLQTNITARPTKPGLFILVILLVQPRLPLKLSLFEVGAFRVYCSVNFSHKKTDIRSIENFGFGIVKLPPR